MNYIINQFPAPTNREKILLAGFMEMYQNGYQGMRIDAVLKATGLAKGALYHHFPNKLSLAYSIIDELLFEHTKKVYESLLSQFDNPIDGHSHILKEFADKVTDEEIALGCPLNNLSQEMSGLDEGFKTRLCSIYNAWHNSLSTSLVQGQDKGYVASDIDAHSTALFIISAHEGILGTSKCMQSRDVLRNLIGTLCLYIEDLRA